MTKIAENHWRYFLSLERDLIELSTYIEISQANYSTFSIQLTKLLLTTCSEVDVVMKLLCNTFEESSLANIKRPNINDYCRVIGRNKQDIFNQDIDVHGTFEKITLNPFENWSEHKSPSWWKNYNDVKHNRSVHFEKANLENLLKSMSGLFLISKILLDETGEDYNEVPTLFTLKGETPPMAILMG